MYRELAKQAGERRRVRRKAARPRPMKVIDHGPRGHDPLARMGGALIALLLAVVASVILAALIASLVPGGYRVRALSYLLLTAWVLIGAVMLLRATFQKESGRFSLGRLAKWMISIWLWPMLLFGRRQKPPA